MECILLRWKHIIQCILSCNRILWDLIAKRMFLESMISKEAYKGAKSRVVGWRRQQLSKTKTFWPTSYSSQKLICRKMTVKGSSVLLRKTQTSLHLWISWTTQFSSALRASYKYRQKNFLSSFQMLGVRILSEDQQMNLKGFNDIGFRAKIFNRPIMFQSLTYSRNGTLQNGVSSFSSVKSSDDVLLNSSPQLNLFSIRTGYRSLWDHKCSYRHSSTVPRWKKIHTSDV